VACRWYTTIRMQPRGATVHQSDATRFVEKPAALTQTRSLKQRPLLAGNHLLAGARVTLNVTNQPCVGLDEAGEEGDSTWCQSVLSNTGAQLSQGHSMTESVLSRPPCAAAGAGGVPTGQALLWVFALWPLQQSWTTATAVCTRTHGRRHCCFTAMRPAPCCSRHAPCLLKHLRPHCSC
jgi:hypothetical protein